MRLNLIFKNGAIFDCHLNNNDFVKRWSNMLKECNKLVPSKHVYELSSQGMGQIDPFENLFDIIAVINNHKADTIPWKYTRESGRTQFTMDDLSDIHFIYEEIAKQHWHSSTKKDRDLLNDYIHQAESKTKFEWKTSPRTRFRMVSSKTGVPNVDKVEFKDSDYKLFTPYRYPYTLYLNYNAVGEDYIKAYKSRRSPKEAVPLKHYSPSFFIEFETLKFPYQKQTINRVRKWMQDGGIDPDCPKESFGHIPLGVLFKDQPDKYYYNTLTTSELTDLRFYD
jgi:hypothetical protein